MGFIPRSHRTMRKIKPETMKEAKAEVPSRPLYPHFSIGMEHLPEAKNWEVGKKYRIALQMKMTGKNIEQRVGKDWSHAEFDIIGIEASLSQKEKDLRNKIRDL